MILTTANQAQGLPVSLLCPVGSYPSFITVRGAQLHSETGWYTIQLVHNYYNHQQQLKEGYKAEQSRTSRIRWKQNATPFVSGSAPDRWVQCQLLSVPIHQISETLEMFYRSNAMEQWAKLRKDSWKVYTRTISIAELTTWWIQAVSQIVHSSFLYLPSKKVAGKLVGAALELSTSALSQSLGSIVQPNGSIFESSSFFYCT